MLAPEEKLRLVPKPYLDATARFANAPIHRAIFSSAALPISPHSSQGLVSATGHSTSS
jgi:hypothetical protein